jgi:hypothetical protein
MSDLTTFLNKIGLAGFVWDPSRSLLDIVTSDGWLYQWSPITQGYVGSRQVGGTPSSVDITPDGSLLVVGNAQPIVTSAPGAALTTYADQVTRIDLNTFATSSVQFPVSGYEGGVSHIAVAADGMAFVTTNFAGSGWTPLRDFEASAASTTIGLVNGQTGVRQSSWLIVSDDRKNILIEEANSSPGPLDLLQSGTDSLIANNAIPGGQGGGGDINDAAGLVADVSYNGIYIYDLKLHQVAYLATLLPPGSGGEIVGAAFAPGGHQLLVWQGPQQQLLVVDTASWTELGSISVPFAAGGGSNQQAEGHMSLADDGRLLLMQTQNGVGVLDLETRLNIDLNVTAGSGDDSLLGYAGLDTLTGGAGNDTIDGGAGWNQADYSGPESDYAIVFNVDGSVTVTDLRSGSPDGSDRLLDIQNVLFADKAFTLSAASAPQVVTIAFIGVLREANPTSADQGFHDLLLSGAQAGSLTADQVAAQIVLHAQSTTSVATTTYQFFTGAVPSSGGMDYLVSPTGPNPNNLNSAYYQLFNIENRYINIAVNLGKLGAGQAAFSATYGSLSLFDATKLAYGTIFGIAPSDTKAHALLDPTVGPGETRGDYFAYYGGDGANGIGTKAAMVGWLLAEAVLADVGSYAKSNDAFLTDVALHNAPWRVDMIGHYNQPGFAFSGG